MKILINYSVWLLCCLLLPIKALPQRFLGISTSEWSSVNSLYLNPANIAGNREQFSVNILSIEMGVDNNLGTLPDISQLSGTTSGNNHIFNPSGRNNFSMMAPTAEVRGPGVVARLTNKISLALTTGIRGINQLNNFDRSLYEALAHTGFTPGQDYNVNMQNFNWTAHMWSEIGLTFGAVVSETDHGRLNFGITVRRLGGIGYISITGRNMDVYYKGGSDSFYAANSDLDFASNVANDSSLVLKRITPSGLLKKFFDESAGGGMSADLGFTYRYRIGEAEPSDFMESALTHDITISCAITDFGAINYFNSANADVGITGNGYLTGNGLSASANNIAGIVSYARHQHFVADSQTRSRKVYLPTALVAGADVQVYDRFYAGLLFIQNLANRMDFGNSYYNQFSLIPRYDSHKMTFALPITYSTLAHDLKMGFGARYSGIFVGSDDVLAAFSRNKYGFSFYIGGYVPIFHTTKDWSGLHWQ